MGGLKRWIERSVEDDSFKPPLAIKHINDPVKERGRSWDLECGIWMGFGQLDQGQGMEVEAETMLWGPDNKDFYSGTQNISLV